jgi:hypothetical protein
MGVPPGHEKDLDRPRWCSRYVASNGDNAKRIAALVILMDGEL